MITDTDDWGWGALVAFRRLGTTPGKSEGPLIGKNESSSLAGVDQNYVLDILLGTSADETGIKPFDKDDDKGNILLVSTSRLHFSSPLLVSTSHGLFNPLTDPINDRRFI